MIHNSNSEKSSVPPLDALTGLRFFAAFGVFLYHALMHLYGRSDFWIISGGAVSFFFVLSGFILTYVYQRRLTRSGVAMFYVTRLARIWPLHVFVLAIAFVFQYQTKYQYYPDLLPKLLGHLLLVQSWVPLESWPMDFNGVAWSISTEFGFYLAFPWLLLLGRRRFAVAYLAIAALTAVGLILINPSSPEKHRLVFTVVYCHPLFRLLEFASGMMVAHAYSLGWHRPLERLPAWSHGIFELGALVWMAWLVTLNANAGFFTPRSGFFPHYTTAFQWISTGGWLAKGAGLAPGAVVIIWVFAWSRGPISYLISRPFIVYLGEISYSFYLVHYIVLNQLFRLDWYSPVLYVAAALLVSLGVSSLLYTLIEVPYRTGIVAAFRGDWSKVWQTLRAVPGDFWRQGIGVAAVLAVASGIWMLRVDMGRSMIENAEAPRKQIGYAVANRGIVFRNEARLLQCDVEYRRNGTLYLRMLWETLPGASRHRFVHIVDEHDQVIRQAKGELEKFRSVRPNTIVLDEVTLRPDQLEGGSKVGIGFFSDKAQACFVESGPRSMKNHRLDVFDIVEGKAIDLSAAFR